MRSFLKKEVFVFPMRGVWVWIFLGGLVFCLLRFGVFCFGFFMGGHLLLVFFFFGWRDQLLHV